MDATYLPDGVLHTVTLFILPSIGLFLSLLNATFESIHNGILAINSCEKIMNYNPKLLQKLEKLLEMRSFV
jgi:sensor histidine kinase regulating citrate/malate metabolism